MPPTSLLSRFLLRYVLGVTVFAAVLFTPAGSFHYWQAWVYIAIFLLSGTPASIYLYKHDPQLLERRMQTKEKVREQKLIMKLAYVVFICALLLPGLDHRFSWSRVPLWLTILSQTFVFVGYLMALWVMKVNRFASRIIEVQPEQKVISAGLYRMVRHPMYLGAIIMYLFTPLALGSYWTLPASVLVIPVIVLRLLNEEKVLRQDLPGYSEFCLQTRFHLIPYVW
jgi:protein-S-isoprenylcysteine O-methyltransferase Ste14